jgi:hypothetical protein
MSERVIEADYVIVGAGACAMAFADELLTHSQATIAIVDRRDSPGGHWNDAYPFVRLHQPSEFYGVNSRELGQHVKYTSGPNKGLYNLASGSEVLGYFDQLMQQRFLPSGRVEYFPLCNVTGDGSFEQILTGQSHRFAARKAVVDAAYCTFDIPSTSPPKFAVASGVRCVPPNLLPRTASATDSYVIAGGGKTAIDTCLWLLERSVDPERIRWIIPRDFWFNNRATVQPGDDFFVQSFGAITKQFEALAAATNVADLFDRLEAAEQLFRLDQNVRPTAYRCAIVSKDELVELRRIKNVIRLGHVQSVERDGITLERGRAPLSSYDLVVNCTASGLSRKPPIPIWADKGISLQLVRTCQPLFSAAFIGFVEAAPAADIALKNALCTPVPLPVVDTDWLTMLAVSTKNRTAWHAHPQIEKWLAQSRLNGFFALAERAKPDDAEKIGALAKFRRAASAGLPRLPLLMAAG